MISARGLSKRYGRTRALTEVNLGIAEGESILIAGPNGSGKSTLLKIIAGLLRPSAGAVTVFGEPPLSSRARIGYIGHESLLYPHLSIEENLELFARLYSADVGPAFGILAKLELTAKRSARAESLSRGEAQKAALTRALLHDPDIVIADEPFTALDGNSAKLASEVLARNGRTVILATHDLVRGGELADRVIHLDGGRLVEST